MRAVCSSSCARPCGLISTGNKIATAATNGAVVIWNVLHRDGRTQKRERVIVEHTRTVNRLTWHPSNAFNLLSGSQDGTMKLWVRSMTI
jgi:WD40 repeat protein